MTEKFSKVIDLFKEKTKKDCYKIDLVVDSPTILDDKIGGLPYLPIGEPYPKDKEGNNLALLLQVNLKNIDLPGYPKNGILEIFTDKDVKYPIEYVIKYFQEGLDYQTTLPQIDLSNYIVNTAYKIKLTKDVCYMPLNDYRFIKTFTPIVNKEFATNLSSYADLDKYFQDFAWYDKVINSLNNPSITIGGYADFVQYDPRSNIKENKDECLFKLDSWLDPSKFHIGDMGILSVLISNKDIEHKDFQRATIDYDCY